MKSKLIILCCLFAILSACICIGVGVFYNFNDMANNQSFDHIKLSEIKSHNWGEVSISDDFFNGTYYEIYRDGEVYTYDLYNKSGKKNEKKFKISTENIKRIESLLKSNINKPADNSAADGTGWTFKYFDVEGKIVGEYTGYIYSNKDFNEILEILK